jgi:hypothetical protein
MSNYISLQGIMLVLFGVAVFTIVLATVYRTLQKTLFQGKTAILMALAVSALCIVGMYHFLEIPGDSPNSQETGNKTNITLSYILLPYVCLAIAILLSQLLLFASKVLSGEKPAAIAKPTKPWLVKPKTAVGRPKKVVSKSPPALQKPAGKGKNEAKTKNSVEETATT